jgi:endonuclease/exonuclease/phosphatase family metal-dependent hydrolase
LKTRTLKKYIRNSAKVILAIIFLALLCLGGFLAYATITDYNPADKGDLSQTGSTLPDTVPAGRLQFFAWNIGYGGLGKNMDFFYEGGTMVRPGRDYYEQSRNGIIRQLTQSGKPDFFLLQEVDQLSDRTYLDDQVKRIKSALSEYTAFFVLNYKVPFVPVPAASPMGTVNSGIMTLSRFRPVEATRYKFPSAYSWPKRLFMLDRCFLLTRYVVSNGKQLVIINTHNSAYADAVGMRAKELKLLKDVMVNEYKRGNYVIVGGDWNQNPVPYLQDSIQDGNRSHTISPGIPDGFLPAGFTWAFDPRHPTNRDVDKPYSKGKTATTIIDFFVLSPNIKMLATHTLQTGFEVSDHQPVEMTLELK